MILVTHDMDEAHALGDRTGVLEGGRVTFASAALTR
jgi:ABC-type proline/glycine betaine transport system ATPase subunit